MINIDGAQGEGGGQIIRSSLTLSALTGKTFEVRNVRAGRKRPGMLRQHVTAANATREICGAGTTGVDLDSSHFTFAPGPLQTRGFRFSVGSAGSAMLVAQTILPALMMADGESTIEVDGGTHNMAAPPFDFLQQCYLPLVNSMGPQIDAKLERYGFYPAGGGRVKFKVKPAEQLKPLQLMENGGSYKPTVIAMVAKLPRHIAEREVSLIQRSAGWRVRDCEIREIAESNGPGNVVMVRLQYPNVTEIFTGFGRKGVTAEQVAKNTWKETRDYLATEAPVGEHLADQLMLPMAIAANQGQISRFMTGPLSRHSRTQMDIIRLFLDVDIQTKEISTLQNEVSIGPA